MDPVCFAALFDAVAETASGQSLAVARVLGSLCVLTARDGEGEGAAEGAMLASWVSQVWPEGSHWRLSLVAEGQACSRTQSLGPTAADSDPAATPPLPHARSAGILRPSW